MALTGDFRARIVGSLYFIPLLLGVISGFPYAVVAGGAVIIWLAYEAALILNAGLRTPRAVFIWFCLILPFPLPFLPLSGAQLLMIWLALYASAYFLNRQVQAGFVGLLMLASICLGIVLSKQDGHLILLFLAAVISAGDIGAYFFGRVLGGPKLAPKISPSKTWTGALGGLFCSLLVVFILSFVLGVSASEPAGWGLAILVSVFAQAGDLFESRLKRRLGIKDSGSFVPGHGGALDRFDGYLGVLPLVAVIDFVQYTPFWLRISAP
jgi:phosphatidate cytidylyltransferase